MRSKMQQKGSPPPFSSEDGTGKFPLLLSLWFIAGLFFIFPRLCAAQTERITNYKVDAEIREDAEVFITEEIEVYVRGDKIKRGIYRDFPTRYSDRYGHNYVVDFEVFEVLRNGSPEPHHFRAESNGQRLYFGQSDVFLKPGYHTYRLRYRTNRQVGFFEKHDEFYFNVLGHGSEFAVEDSTVTVRLPPAVSSADITADGYSGYAGASDRDFTAEILREQKAVRYKITKPLPPHAGLTVVITWPKGFVTEPDFKKKLGYFLRDNRSSLIGGMGLLFILFIYTYSWYAVGRDPAKGTIIPQFSAPDKMSAAEVRYIFKMGFDNKVFTAALLDMAIKGHLLINRGAGDEYSIQKLTNGSELRPEEKLVSEMLFGRTEQFTFNKRDHSIISEAKSALSGEYERRHLKQNFSWNKGYVFAGAGASVLVVFFMAYSTGFRGHEFWNLVNVLICALLAILPFIFGYLMKAPSAAGRKLMDRIEGFRMYLSTAEKERLNAMNPPEKDTPELWEKFLPFAIALGVENRWSERFASALSGIDENGVRYRDPYRPVWYSGGRFDSGKGFDSGKFTSSVGSAFSAAIASSSIAPGSSSGSGGGGSSGGGGGGGGVGGW